MRIRSIALSGALAASTLLAAPAMATESTPPADPTAVTQAPAPAKFRNTCNPAIAALPASVEADPMVKPGALNPQFAPGLYVWHEAKGWRVRLTHNQRPQDVNGVKPQVIEVRGRITASRPISNVRTVRLEDKQRGEWVSVQRPKRKVMDFRFVNGGYIDGINFNAGCAGTADVHGVAGHEERRRHGLVRTPLPIYVGSDIANPVTAAAPEANPGLVITAAAERVVIRRAPVPAP